MNRDICWKCLQPWLSSNISQCGREECDGSKEMNNILQTCGTKTIGTVGGVPEIRMCNNCETLIQH